MDQQRLVLSDETIVGFHLIAPGPAAPQHNKKPKTNDQNKTCHLYIYIYIYVYTHMIYSILYMYTHMLYLIAPGPAAPAPRPMSSSRARGAGYQIFVACL